MQEWQREMKSRPRYANPDNPEEILIPGWEALCPDHFHIRYTYVGIYRNPLSRKSRLWKLHLLFENQPELPMENYGRYMSPVESVFLASAILSQGIRSILGQATKSLCGVLFRLLSLGGSCR
jgi:hypothetical protein